MSNTFNFNPLPTGQRVRYASLVKLIKVKIKRTENQLFNHFKQILMNQCSHICVVTA